MKPCDTSSVVAWLIDGARSCAEPQQVLADMCVRLCECGIPLWCVEVFVRTLHPEVVGRRFRWQPGKDISVSMTTYDVSPTAQSRKSFVEHLCAGDSSVRVRLNSDSDIEFPLLKALRAEGATDLLGAPLVFTKGDAQAAIFTTREPDGFSSEQLAGLEAVIKPLSRIAEVRALQRTATNLLNTYVGARAGERILAGQIRRGHTESINAAIWLSDMRGFTTLSDRVSARVMIGILNDYFDCQVPSILRHGGEVLKFMGDGLLAMFPIGNDRDPAEVCARALASAY